jgi:hypothetical protein
MNPSLLHTPQVQADEAHRRSLPRGRRIRRHRAS